MNIDELLPLFSCGILFCMSIEDLQFRMVHRFWVVILGCASLYTVFLNATFGIGICIGILPLLVLREKFPLCGRIDIVCTMLLVLVFSLLDAEIELLLWTWIFGGIFAVYFLLSSHKHRHIPYIPFLFLGSLTTFLRYYLS